MHPVAEAAPVLGRGARPARPARPCVGPKSAFRQGAWRPREVPSSVTVGRNSPHFCTRSLTKLLFSETEEGWFACSGEQNLMLGGKRRGRSGEQSPARPRGAAGVPGAEGAAGRPAVHTPWRRVRWRPPRDPVGSPCTPPQAPRHVAGSACTSVTHRTRVVWPTRVTMRGLRPPRRQGDTRVTTATGTSHHPQDGCARPDAAPRPWHPPSTTGLVPA